MTEVFAYPSNEGAVQWEPSWHWHCLVADILLGIVIIGTTVWFLEPRLLSKTTLGQLPIPEHP